MSNSKLPKPTAHGKQRSQSPKRKTRDKQSKKHQKTPLPPDAREQLFNEGHIGPIQDVQVSTERVVKLSGILLDLDPRCLKRGPLIPSLVADPVQFYEQCVQPWLTRHRVLDQLEIRMSGTGLHGILWFDMPIEFADDAERDRWCSIYKIIQAGLPTDPHAPGITATIRPIGSINTKNKKKVRLLRKGSKVSPSDVLGLQQQICAAPFKHLFHVLTGTDEMSPCPFCGVEGTTISALDYVGMCYGCGKVAFDKLCHQLFRDGKSEKE